MSVSTDPRKKWEGRIVDGKFPLRQWLGGSDHSAVFLTEISGTNGRKAAIKLVSANGSRPQLGQEPLQPEAQLSRWAEAAKLSHPHLVRLIEWGRCTIDDTPMFYAVMEHADENLSEILPVRLLSSEEATATLIPAAEALAALHRAGFIHGRIKPTNILAVEDQLKLSTDELAKAGDRVSKPGLYDAPEIATSGLTPASDIWSLGRTLLAVITQKEPQGTDTTSNSIAVPETVAQPLRDVLRKCLQVDPQLRGSSDDILRQLKPSAIVPRPAAPAVEAPASAAPSRPKRWIIVPVVVLALFLIALAGGKFLSRPSANPPTLTQPVGAQPEAEVPAAQSPASSSVSQPAQKSAAQGSVREQVMPDISRGAQNTIHGTIKINIQVEVDSAGTVSEAKLASPAVSRYFADRALAAAKRWRFTPPLVGGEASGSEWLLRFQFGRNSMQVLPTQTKP